MEQKEEAVSGAPLSECTEQVTINNNVFSAGCISNYYHNWEKVTTDKWILNSVVGYEIELEQCPIQQIIPLPIPFSRNEHDIISKLVIYKLKTGIIEQVSHSDYEFISNVFIRPKKNGTFRFILNLSKLNEFVTYHHFKMDSISTVINLMRPNCYMGSIDLKDAYFSVSIINQSRKLLRFYWNDTLYQFTCLPNGLASAPRVFTKLLKPIYAKLRENAHIACGYIDDSFIMGHNELRCANSIHAVLKSFMSLGFCINEEKSIVKPVQRLQHLGFILDSVNMTIELPVAKKEIICDKFKDLLKQQQVTIQHVAECIGLIVSSFPGVDYGPLFYRHIEMDKTEALKRVYGDYSAFMILSPEAKSEIQWWLFSLPHALKQLHRILPRIVLTTDASNEGWGAVVEDNSTGGRWSVQEQCEHINVLELKAVYLGLQTYFEDKNDVNVKVKIDNTTAVAYINNMGGIKSLKCNSLAKEIWLWCKARTIWIIAAHLQYQVEIIWWLIGDQEFFMIRLNGN